MAERPRDRVERPQDRTDRPQETATTAALSASHGPSAMGDGGPVTWRASPNHGPRRPASRRPTLVILHYTGMARPADALGRLTAEGSGVSAHYQIDPDGALHALVPEAERAWHAGVAHWRGEDDVNSASIGIELAHPGHRQCGAVPPFPEPQWRRLETLLAALRARWGLAPDAMLAHSDVAPGRKIDPGEGFDWARLARLGLAVAPERAEVVAADSAPGAPFHAALDAIGYGDWPDDARIDAFRRRFRPSAVGRPLEPADAALARATAAAFAAARGAAPQDHGYG